MSDAHSPLAPGLPNGSVDFNALHDAAIAGTLGDEVTDSAVLIGEQGRMLTDASNEVDVQANIDAATPAERAKMAEYAAPLVSPSPISALAAEPTPATDA